MKRIPKPITINMNDPKLQAKFQKAMAEVTRMREAEKEKRRLERLKAVCTCCQIHGRGLR